MATVSTNKKYIYIWCIHITFHKLGTNYRQQQQRNNNNNEIKMRMIGVFTRPFS